MRAALVTPQQVTFSLCEQCSSLHAEGLTDQHLSMLCLYKNIRTRICFCRHDILTECVFVTQRSRNVGISVRLIVWVMTNCSFMRDMLSVLLQIRAAPSTNTFPGILTPSCYPSSTNQGVVRSGKSGGLAPRPPQISHPLP